MSFFSACLVVIEFTGLCSRFLIIQKICHWHVCIINSTRHARLSNSTTLEAIVYPFDENPEFTAKCVTQDTKCINSFYRMLLSHNHYVQKQICNAICPNSFIQRTFKFCHLKSALNYCNSAPPISFQTRFTVQQIYKAHEKEGRGARPIEYHWKRRSKNRVSGADLYTHVFIQRL